MTMDAETRTALSDSIDDTLESIAEAARQDDETMEQAFARLTETDEGFQAILENQKNLASPSQEDPTVEPDGIKLDKARQDGAELELEVLTKALMAKDNLSYTKAYDNVLRTPRGAELYKSYVQNH